jgi:hypothetical protein
MTHTQKPFPVLFGAKGVEWNVVVGKTEECEGIASGSDGGHVCARFPGLFPGLGFLVLLPLPFVPFLPIHTPLLAPPPPPKFIMSLFFFNLSLSHTQSLLHY